MADPKGLSVEWKGKILNAGATMGLGVQAARFELTSECKCGRRLIVTGWAVFASIGGGLSLPIKGKFSEASGTSSSITLWDPTTDCPDEKSVSGMAWQSGINVVPVAGFTLFPAWRLGKLRMYDWIDGPAWGFDMSVTSTLYGRTFLDPVRVENCEDCKK